MLFLHRMWGSDSQPCDPGLHAVPTQPAGHHQSRHTSRGQRLLRLLCRQSLEFLNQPRAPGPWGAAHGDPLSERYTLISMVHAQPRLGVLRDTA